MSSSKIKAGDATNPPTIEGQNLLGMTVVERKRKGRSEEEIEKDRKRRGCIKQMCGIEAKKNISCLNIISLFLIFLMGGLSGNGTVLQTVYLLGAAGGKDEESAELAKESAH